MRENETPHEVNNNIVDFITKSTILQKSGNEVNNNYCSLQQIWRKQQKILLTSSKSLDEVNNINEVNKNVFHVFPSKK